MKKIVLFGIICAIHSVLADVNTPHLCLPPPSQKCFTVIVDQKLNWVEAEEWCEKNLLNGRLASVHNAFEGAVMTSWLSFLTTDPWIGAFRLGGLPYQWVDGTALNYSNWAPGQPNGNCAQICHMTGSNNGVNCQQGKWRAAECDKTLSQVICEYGNNTSPPTTPSTTTTTTVPTPKAVDCLDLHHKLPHLASGLYLLSPPGADPFYAYCDMETDGGGWTVFQRRVDGNFTFFDKYWRHYKAGFNDTEMKNLWLGNDHIHILSTKDPNVELRIDIWGDRRPGSPYANGYWWQKQSSFYIDDESKQYTFHVNSTVTGNASVSGDMNYGINFNVGKQFSTMDYILDACGGCCHWPPFQLGGWWLHDCTWSSLNGKYVPSSWQNQYGFEWRVNEKTGYINPAQSRMMLRKAA